MLFILTMVVLNLSIKGELNVTILNELINKKSQKGIPNKSKQKLSQ